MKLQSQDYPLTAIGNRIYARRWSSPILTATDDEMAAEIALRLNRDDQCFPVEAVTLAGTIGITEEE